MITLPRVKRALARPKLPIFWNWTPKNINYLIGRNVSFSKILKGAKSLFPSVHWATTPFFLSPLHFGSVSCQSLHCTEPLPVSLYPLCTAHLSVCTKPLLISSSALSHYPSSPSALSPCSFLLYHLCTEPLPIYPTALSPCSFLLYHLCTEPILFASSHYPSSLHWATTHPLCIEPLPILSLCTEPLTIISYALSH